MNKRLLTMMVAAALLAGCKKNGASIELVGFCGYPKSGQDCAPKGTCSVYLTGNDTYYLASSSLGYYVEVSNQLVGSANPDTGATNAHDAYVEGSTMSYAVDVSQSRSTAAFSLPDDEAGTIEMKVAADGGSATPWLEVIPPATMQRLAANIAANDGVLLTIDVHAKVRFVDQSVIERTAPIRYWVWVVNAPFSGYVCPDPTQEVVSFCGVYGDAAVTLNCKTPGAVTTYTVGGVVAGLGGGTTLNITCTLAGGAAVTLPPMTGPGSFTCGSAASGDSYTISLVSSGGTGQTCTFDANTSATYSGQVGNAAISQAVTCAP